MRDHVELDLELACIVGILPRERIEPQPLQVRLQMGIDLDPCGRTGDLEQSVDYGAVDTQVRFLCTEGRFRLIEVLSVAVLRLVLAPPSPGESRSPLSWASVRIRKPVVLRSAVPGVHLERDAAWAAGHDVLADVREVHAERVTLDAGATFERARARALRISEAHEPIELPYTAPSPQTLLVVQGREPI